MALGLESLLLAVSTYDLAFVCLLTSPLGKDETAPTCCSSHEVFFSFFSLSVCFLGPAAWCANHVVVGSFKHPLPEPCPPVVCGVFALPSPGLFLWSHYFCFVVS